MRLQRHIEPDHLGSPRKVIDPSRGTALWDWPILGNAFGTAAANDDADGDGNATSLNLRFPGQQYDAATGLHYNYFRDYDPSTGRYVESDPVGLWGGLATYSYSDQAPIAVTDRLGLHNGCRQGGRSYDRVHGCWNPPPPVPPKPSSGECRLECKKWETPDWVQNSCYLADIAGMGLQAAKSVGAKVAGKVLFIPCFGAATYDTTTRIRCWWICEDMCLY